MIEIRGMRPEELETVHQMLDRAFTKTPKSYFDSQVKNDPYLEPDDTRVLLEDGIIRSCVRVYFRDIRCMGTKLRMGGIGDVGTDPEIQGRGFAYKLLQEAIAYMRKKGTDISFLFTSINPFYQRSGYFSLPMKKMIIDTPPPSSTPPWRKVRIRKDLSALQALYDHQIRDRVGPVLRDEKYWKAQMHFTRINPDLFWVGLKGNTITCYVRGFKEESFLKIQEFAFLPGEEDLLRELIALMASRIENKIHISLISQKEVDLFMSWKPAVMENTSLMVRFIDPGKLALYQKLFSEGRLLFWESDGF